MSHIIFNTFLENIYKSSNLVNDFMNNKEKYFSNTYRTLVDIPNNSILFYFFIVLFIYALFKNADIGLSNIFSLLVSILIIYILLQRDYANFNKFIDHNNDKLNFLNSFLSDKYTNIPKGSFGNIINIRGTNRIFSYLYYDSDIVEVMYNLKPYINLNIGSYANCLRSINSLLKISFMSDNLTENLQDNFESMIRLKNEALNSLSTIIYTLPIEYITYNKFNRAIKTLHIILNSHIAKVSNIFKNKVRKDKSKDKYTPLDIFDFYDTVSSNDMKLKDYNPTYDLY